MVIEGCKCGKPNCNGICSYSIGRRLAKFIKGLDGEDTKIGDISPVKSDGLGLIYTGISLYTKGDVGDILQPTNSVSLPIESKFDGFVEDRPILLLTSYMDKNNLSYDEKSELLTKFKKLERNKLLPVPIKPGTRCVVKVTNENGVTGGKRELKVNTYIQYVEYKLDKGTKHMEYSIVTSLSENLGGGQLRFNIEDYCNDIWVYDTESVHIVKDIAEPIIKFTRFGIIRPVELINKTSSLVVDNEGAYIRCIAGKPMEMIAVWVGRELKLQDKEYKHNKLFMAIKKNEDYIYRHKRYIAPYGLVDTHKIELK